MYAYRWLGGAVLHMRYSVHVHPFELGLSQGGRIIRARASRSRAAGNGNRSERRGHGATRRRRGGAHVELEIIDVGG